MRTMLLIGLVMGICPGRAHPDDEGRTLQIHLGKTAFKSTESVGCTLANKSTDTVLYWVAPMRWTGNRWREIPPLDIEGPHRTKSVQLHTISPGESRTLKWAAPQESGREPGRYRFVVNLSRRPSPPFSKIYSLEFEIVD